MSLVVSCLLIVVIFSIIVALHVVDRSNARSSSSTKLNYRLGTRVFLITMLCCLLIAVIVIRYLLTPIDAILHLSSIQAALDAQCHDREYVADITGFDDSLYPTWQNHEGTVFCTLGDPDKTGWQCSCTNVTPTPDV
jgi:hypothetical protein